VLSDDLATFLSILLKEHDMPPCRCAKVASVVVGIATPDKSVIWHFVPFFAGDLARFATNADSWIREEADFDIFLDVIVPTLVRAVCALADHENQMRKAGTQENTAQEGRFIWTK
jgi:hypothetical protein